MRVLLIDPAMAIALESKAQRETKPVAVGGSARTYLQAKFDTGSYGTAIQVGGGLTGTVPATQLAVFGDVAYQHRGGDSGVDGWTITGGLRVYFWITSRLQREPHRHGRECAGGALARSLLVCREASSLRCTSCFAAAPGDKRSVSGKAKGRGAIALASC